MDSISMCSNTFYMSNMEVRSSLRWPSASTMTCSHYFDDSASHPEPQNLRQAGWVKLCKAATVCPWTAYQCAQTLFICLMWMYRKQFELAVSLNHDVMTSFWLHKWPRTRKNPGPSWVGISVWGCYYVPMDSILMCSNTLYMFNVDVGSSLRWLSATTMM